jgi:catechol 2,3-dioxygenase-like lactoylglutathione lyase family enzyme
MTTRWTLTFDCHDAAVMARFWTVALGYVEAPPPEGWDTWEDWLRHFEVPEDEWDDGSSLEDPQGVLPSISFLKVPEPKSAKNRLHLDLQVAGGRHVDQTKRESLIEGMADVLVEAGGSVAFRSMQGDRLDHVVMRDPEGNEFCVV